MKQFSASSAVFLFMSILISETGQPDGNYDPEIKISTFSERSVYSRNTYTLDTAFTTHVISTTEDGARSVNTVDMDGDGDLDILSATYDGKSISWFENTGSGNFSNGTVIFTEANSGMMCVEVADLDGDGNMDAISLGNDLVWHKNDGNENFTADTINSTLLQGRFVEAVDLDEDGDMDLLSASCDDILSWYENDGTGNFTTHTISNGLQDCLYSVRAGDMDGDGDLDVVAVSYTDGNLVLYTNDGSENFTSNTISTELKLARALHLADMDGDGDMDPVGISHNSSGFGGVYWFKNNNSGQNFTKESIDTTLFYSWAVYAADMDGDGDMDVLSGESEEDIIIFHENDGNENFTNRYLTSTADKPRSVHAADVDGDGDLDVLSASAYDDKIAWYEQSGVGVLNNYTYVPDDNFEQALIDLGYDNIMDNYVSTDSISGITHLYVDSMAINDLTGIEDFTALTVLGCWYNQLSTLDVSNNTSLAYLHVGNNQLTTLDVSQNIELTILYVGYNSLTALDVSTNTALSVLGCWSNQLTNLDVSNNTSLTKLQCQNNQLTDLDVTNNTGLVHLNCNNNQLTTLDVGQNTALTHLNCGVNNLTTIDLSNNAELITLYGNNNTLTTLDISSNLSIQWIYCYNNQLTTLDVSTNTALTKLHCYSNELTSLNLTGATALTSLNVYNNDLTVLNVTNNTELSSLICRTNQLASLDLSNNANLTDLRCQENILTSIDVSANTGLTRLWIQNNQLTGLDLSANTALTELQCMDNTSLYCIQVTDSSQAAQNWSNDISDWMTFSEDCLTLPGCMDPTSCNYNPGAMVDDGSCTDFVDCAGNCAGTYAVNNCGSCVDTVDVPIQLNGSPPYTSNYTLLADGSLEVPVVWPFPELDGAGNITEVIFRSDWWNKRPKDMEILYGETVIASWTHPSSGCSDGLNDYIENGLSSNCSVSTPSFSTGILNQEVDFDNADSLSLRVVSAWNTHGIYFNGAWVIDGDYCIQDCEGVWGGNAVVDDCGVCNGGNISCTGCTDAYADNYDSTAIINHGCYYPDNGEYSLSFDGVNDYIDISGVSDDLDGDTTFSIFFSANPKTASFPEGTSYVFSINGSSGGNVNILLLGLNRNGSLSIHGPNSTEFTSTASIVDNNWYNIAYTRNGSLGTLYLDGVELGTHTVIYSLSSSDYWSIGQEFDGTSVTNEYVGHIDNVSVWDRALSEQEIQNNAAGTLSGNEDGLRGYWIFNNGSDTIAYDHSGNANHGNILGATWSMYGCTDPYAGNYDSTATMDDGSCAGYPDNGGYSLQFDGTDDYVQTGLYLNNLPYTIKCTFKADANSGEQSIVDTDIAGSYGNSIILGYGNGDNTIDVQYHNGSYNSPFQYQADTWYDVVATFEEGMVKLYVDGLYVGSKTYSQSNPDGSAVRFGRHNAGDSQWFGGNIDNVAIWGTALDSLEINSLFNSNNNIDLLSDFDNYSSANFLEGYWKFNTGMDTVLYDHSGNANHGDIIGASWNVSLTHVPDDNFEQTLIDLGYDDVLDDYVVTDSIISVTYLDVNNDSISDLTGIEDFASLTTLTCVGNELTSLDMSGNPALIHLNCYANSLTNLNVSNNPLLEFLWCQNNQLNSLDVSNNTLVTELMCHSNRLNILDLTTNTVLEILRCDGNQFTALDLSNNTALKWIWCQGNQLTTLDFSNNIAMETIRCDNNNLSSINIFNNPALTTLQCYSNQLTTLDVSQNTELTELRCNTNQLDSLDVSNNTSLTYLHAGSNNLTSVDVSQNTELTSLYVGFNSLENLDVSLNTALRVLKCGSNQLQTLDVSMNTALENLDLWANQIQALDVSANTALTNLKCASNPLTYLNIRNGVTDQVTNFNATNTHLSCIETLNPDYATANWTSANGNIDTLVTFSFLCGSQNQNVWHISSTTGSDGNGRGTFESPFSTIQMGINIADEGNTVSVMEGRYVENIDFTGKSIRVNGSGPELTVIDGDSTGSVVVMDSGEDSTTVLSGFTITNGASNYGAGLYIKNGASPILEDLRISSNHANTAGAGMYVWNDAKVHIRNMHIYDNEAGGSGGGILIGSESELTISDAHIYDNTSGNSGGGMMIGATSTVTVEHAVIVGNSALKGGGIASKTGSSTFHHATVSDNSASGEGNGIYLRLNAEMVIHNSIVTANDSDVVFIDDSLSTLDISYSNIEGGWPGEGNIDADPLFCDPESGDYHLAVNSSSVGAGQDGYDMGASGVGCDVINDAPVAYDADVFTDENTPVTITLNGDDINGDYFTFEVVEEPGNGNLSSHGQYLNFDGVDDYVEIPSASFGGLFSIQAWVYTTDIYQNWQRIIDFGNGSSDNNIVLGFIGNEGRMFFESYDGNRTEKLITDALFPQNQWVHVVAINDADGNASIYWNGELKAEGVIFPIRPVLRNNQYIGRSNWSHDSYFVGKMKNIAIWNDTLTVESITTLFNDGNGVDASVNTGGYSSSDDLVAYWEFNEGTGTILSDDASNGYDGTIDGASWSDPSFVYTPNQYFFGTDMFKFVARDMYDVSNIATVDLTVNEVILEEEIPDILTINDIPGDQGGWVYLEFESSVHDNGGSQGAYTFERLDGTEWISLHSIDAYGNDRYTTEARTRFDSTSVNNAVTSFRVIGNFQYGVFESDPVEGYSVDNIAPAVPGGLIAQLDAGMVNLEWSPAEDDDFSYFQIFREMSENFIPADGNMIGESAVPSWTDSLTAMGSYYYKVNAVDANENESAPSEPVNVAVLSLEDLLGLPEVYSLHQNYPNPFNPVTRIRYDLPEDGMVTINIYDVMGRNIKSLINNHQIAGYRSIRWDATNNLGEPVSAGMYIYMIQAGKFRQTKKMILLK